MRIIFLLLLLEYNMVFPSTGQQGAWGTGIYSAKHADIGSSANQTASLAALPQEGVSAGMYRDLGLPELDVY
ncbi:MAG: hypothetical protein J7527_14175 [Chitinophagaceae bacterium]|nr:hypothetical protein [Chitinophagaceae bacterium]